MSLMSWHTPVRALALAVVSLFGASGLAQADSAKPLTDAQVWKAASDLDPLKLTRPRRTLKGGYITPSGLQIHASCFEYAKKAGLKRETVEAAADRITRNAFESVGISCLAKYPEIRPYATEFAAQFRRTIITCSDKTQKEHDVGAMNLGAAPSLWVKLKASEREGIDTAGLLGSLNAAYKPTIFYPYDSFVETMTYPDNPGELAGFIHEVLHGTNANNTAEHNDIENVAPGKQGSCGRDVRDDRVNMLAALCTNTGLLGGSNQHAAIDLFERESQCGRKCEHLFSMDANDEARDLVDMIHNAYLPSKGLPKAQAQSLCAKLYDEGFCRSTLAKQGEKVTKSAIPQLNEVGDRVRSRLYNLFPISPVQLNNDVLKLAPEAYKALVAQKDTQCFKSVFRDVVGDHLYIQGADKVAIPANPTPEEFANAHFAEAKKAINASRDCLPSERAELNFRVRQVQQEVSSALNSSAYWTLVYRRALHQAELDYVPSGWYSGSDTRLRELLGPALYDEYLSALEKFHYKSPNFDCAAANLVPLKNIGKFQSLAGTTGPSGGKCEGK